MLRDDASKCSSSDSHATNFYVWLGISCKQAAWLAHDLACLQGFGQHMSSMDAIDPRRLLLETPHRSKRLSARLLQPWSANTAQAPRTPGQQAPQHAPAAQTSFPPSPSPGTGAMQSSANPALGTARMANQQARLPSPGTPPRNSPMPSLSPSLGGTSTGASGVSSGSILGSPWPQSQQQGEQSQWSLPGMGQAADGAAGAAAVDAAAAFGSPNQTAAGGSRGQASVGHSPRGIVKRGRSAEEDDDAGETNRSFVEHQRQQQLLRYATVQTQNPLCLGHAACPTCAAYTKSGPLCGIVLLQSPHLCRLVYPLPPLARYLDGDRGDRVSCCSLLLIAHMRCHHTSE